MKDVKRILEGLFIRSMPTSSLLPYARSKFPKRIKRLSEELGLPAKQIVYHMFVSPKVRTCPACGKISQFRTLNIGYIVCCSLECSRSPEVVKMRVRKSQKTSLKRYGATHAMQNAGVRKKFKRTMIKKYGVANALESVAIREAMREKIFEKWGVDHPMRSREVKLRIADTCIRRYGVASSFASKDVQRKSQQTNLRRYGCRYALENADVQKRRIATLMRNYGVDQPMQSFTIQRRRENTMLERYGVRHPMQSSDLYEKARRSSRARFGVDHPMQNAAVFCRAQSSRFRSRNLTYRGKTYTSLIGGYEPRVVRKLVDMGYDVSSRCKLTFPYRCSRTGRERVYHPDLYVGKGSRRYVVEVKSTYTAGLQCPTPGRVFRNLVDKAAAVTSAGYQFRLVVLVRDRMRVFAGVPRWADLANISP